MSKVVLSPRLYVQLSELDILVHDINKQKIWLLFDELGVQLTETDFMRVMNWELIMVAVADKQMAVHLNKLAAYIPNLKFVPDAERKLFELQQGDKGKRVWKER